ncbi:LysR family transcriptional regulator [Azospira sp. I13]|uniref:LysR family transcriptional regulator n=1 Tax=Azospira sp. I13 TaxID=1765050 RepID=UPI000D43E414|nr:LysR family transcriptional regulator [Azospira sp. I13]GBG01499.1 LysR family transcriptional regulator [Azospira sp. I13]
MTPDLNLDANDLVLFARIMEAGSFSKAAERVGLPKSTLSRRITALETTLGERLLTRSTRRLTITEFGEGILDHARRLLEETEATAALALHRQATPQGVLRVSMPPDFGELDLAPALIDFAAHYPAVRLELDLSPRRVDLVAERFDLAVRVASQLPDDATLVARRLTQFQTNLYASPAYIARHGAPQTPAELLDHTCLRLITSSGEAQPWRLNRGNERWEGMPSGPLAANSVGMQRTLAAHGMGIVALTDRFVQTYLDSGRLQRVLPEWELPCVTVWCITPGRRLLPTRTQAFIDMLKRTLG